MDGSDSSNAEPLADAEEIAQIASAQWLSEQKAAAAVLLRQLQGHGGLPQDVYRAAGVMTSGTIGLGKTEKVTATTQKQRAYDALVDLNVRPRLIERARNLLEADPCQLRALQMVETDEGLWVHVVFNGGKQLSGCAILNRLGDFGADVPRDKWLVPDKGRLGNRWGVDHNVATFRQDMKAFGRNYEEVPSENEQPQHLLKALSSEANQMINDFMDADHSTGAQELTVDDLMSWQMDEVVDLLLQSRPSDNVYVLKLETFHKEVVQKIQPVLTHSPEFRDPIIQLEKVLQQLIDKKDELGDHLKEHNLRSSAANDSGAIERQRLAARLARVRDELAGHLPTLRAIGDEVEDAATAGAARKAEEVEEAEDTEEAEELARAIALSMHAQTDGKKNRRAMDGSDSSNAEPLADAEEIAQIESAQWLSEQKAAAAVRLRQLTASESRHAMDGSDSSNAEPLADATMQPTGSQSVGSDDVPKAKRVRTESEPLSEVQVVVAGAVPDMAIYQLREILQHYPSRGELRLLPNELMRHMRRSFTPSQLEALNAWEPRAVATEVDLSMVKWSDDSAGRRDGKGVTPQDSVPFISLAVPLELAIVLTRIQMPNYPLSCWTPMVALSHAVRSGRVQLVRRLLEFTPDVIDLEITVRGRGLQPCIRQPGAYDTEPLYIACCEDDLPADTRLKLVRTLLHAYVSRAQDQGCNGHPFDVLHRNRETIGYTASHEYRALQAALERGHAACVDALIRAGVPIDASAHTDPEERAVVESILANNFEMLQQMLRRRGQGAQMNPENIQRAQALFGDNQVMAFGYLVGALGLENRPPPDGWASLDPGGVKAKALRDALQTEAQLHNYESRLLHLEMTRLRDELLREQRPQKVGSELLAFVCNPDFGPERERLRQALNDALAASSGMPATIIGGAAAPINPRGQPTDASTWSTAITEDRTCTFERLERELSERQQKNQLPRAFLFSGHANVNVQGHNKTLGFTGPDGKLERLANPDEVAQLLGRYARANGSSSGIELVVLNGCESEKLGRACRDHKVPYVVCWRTMVSDEAAYLFARGFFRALGSSGRLHDDYRRAFDAGKSAVTQKTRLVATDNGNTYVPYFALRDPAPLMPSGVLPNGSYAGGLPVLLSSTPFAEYV